MDGGCGGRECDSRVGDEMEEFEVDDEEKGTRRFLREKDCSAWEKWVGTGSGSLDTEVSTATGIVPFFFFPVPLYEVRELQHSKESLMSQM